MVSRRDDRSQLIRAFDDWLEEAKPRFSFPPRVTHREGHELRMGFDGIHRLVVATLCGCGPERAEIAVDWMDDPPPLRGRLHTLQASRSAEPAPPEGEPVFCPMDAEEIERAIEKQRTGQSDPTPRDTAVRSTDRVLAEEEFDPSREVFWRESLFEPFLTWVNGTLAHSSFALLVSASDVRGPVPASVLAEVFDRTDIDFLSPPGFDGWVREYEVKLVRDGDALGDDFTHLLDLLPLQRDRWVHSQGEGKEDAS